MSIRSRLAVGIPFFALMFIYLCLRAYLGGIAPQQYSRRGWSSEWRDGRAVIASVLVNSPATGVLREGDVIVAISSENPALTRLVAPVLAQVPPGTQYKMVVSRDGQTLEAQLHTTTIYTNAPTGWAFILFMLTLLLFLGAGVTVFLLKPDDEQAWMLALISATPITVFPLNPSLPMPWWMFFTALLAQTLTPIFYPVILRFFLVFPERSPILKRFPKLESLTYMPFLIFMLPLITLRNVLSAFRLSPPWRESFMASTGNIVIGLAVAYMLASLAAMVIN